MHNNKTIENSNMDKWIQENTYQSDKWVSENSFIRKTMVIDAFKGSRYEECLHIVVR